MRKVKLTQEDIQSAIEKNIAGFGPKYHEACYIFKKGMIAAVKVINKKHKQTNENK